MIKIGDTVFHKDKAEKPYIVRGMGFDNPNPLCRVMIGNPETKWIGIVLLGDIYKKEGEEIVQTVISLEIRVASSNGRSNCEVLVRGTDTQAHLRNKLVSILTDAGFGVEIMPLGQTTLCVTINWEERMITAEQARKNVAESMNMDVVKKEAKDAAKLWFGELCSIIESVSKQGTSHSERIIKVNNDLDCKSIYLETLGAELKSLLQGAGFGATAQVTPSDLRVHVSW